MHIKFWLENLKVNCNPKIQEIKCQFLTTEVWKDHSGDKWEGNVRINVWETGWEDVAWDHLTWKWGQTDEHSNEPQKVGN
jgi:hypothetical protein